MTTHPYFELTVPQGGQIWLTPCPGTQGPDLATSLGQMALQGANHCVTLLTQHDLADLGLSDFGEQAQRAGLSWWHCPIEDDQGPQEAFERAWYRAKPALLEALKQGQRVVVHCKGGTGRTGLVAALLLLELGVDHEQAQARVQALRPKALTPPAQRQYFMAYLPGKEA